MLALELGMWPSQVLAMPNSDFNLFYAFHQISPIGRDRFDVLAAIGAAASTNIHLPKKDRVSPEKFLPPWHSKPRKPWDHKAFFSALDSLVERQNKRGT